MTADEEDNYCVGQAKEPLDEEGRFINERIVVRWRDETIEVPARDVDYIDVSPKQVVSVATAMIPFLENDDANRALMGSNMQRQAVPLLVPEAPIVGTGMEYKAAHDSGVVLLSKHAGVVDSVDADEIRVPSRHLYEHDGSASAFLRVLLHEMSHSTGKPLGRDLKNKFGSPEYATEELVAELSALFTASALGFALDFTDMDDEFSHRHVAYIQHWAQHITDNPDVLFQVVGKASKASDLLLDRYFKTPSFNAAA
jgi:hypothetical protein